MTGDGLVTREIEDQGTAWRASRGVPLMPPDAGQAADVNERTKKYTEHTKKRGRRDQGVGCRGRTKTGEPPGVSRRVGWHVVGVSSARRAESSQWIRGRGAPPTVIKLENVRLLVNHRGSGYPPDAERCGQLSSPARWQVHQRAPRNSFRLSVRTCHPTGRAASMHRSM